MTNNESLLSWEELDRILTVDIASGQLHWKSPRPKVKVGSIAGWCEYPRGYWNLCINRRRYWRHRLIWFYKHKQWPSADIDHINGVAGDDRIDNLREATRSQNLQNRKLGSNNTSGHKGVSWNKRANKWEVRASGKYLGLFSQLEQALNTYSSYANVNYGEFRRI